MVCSADRYQIVQARAAVVIRRFMTIDRYVLAEKSCGKYFDFGVVDGACDCVPQSHSECKEADAENYHVYLGHFLCFLCHFLHLSALSVYGVKISHSIHCNAVIVTVV